MEMSEMKPIRIGTRASQLALWQARWCASRLRENGIPVEIVEMTASGDRPETFGQPIAAGGAQGIFTRVIQDALLANEVDIAVHSLKDLPTEAVPGLQLTAVPPRAPVEDVLVMSRNAKSVEKMLSTFTGNSNVNQVPLSLRDLPDGAILGTSSLRRRAQLLAFAQKYGKKWDILSVRGNLNTRLRKLDEGLYDALILARAGLERLEMAERITAFLPFSEMFPAVSQGALGIESRIGDSRTNEILAFYLNDPVTLACVSAERAFLKALDGGCATPIGGLCECRMDAESCPKNFTLRGRVIALDGRKVLEDSLSVAIHDEYADKNLNEISGNLCETTVKLGIELAQKLILHGADV
ncbi:MAG: hydroxymethylbilane synthase, partial [Planctomycetia bacterium]|nr:hydroxymethylbilane synthase [Planctomycetia bacterium]